jgi:hypothetical protein
MAANHRTPRPQTPMTKKSWTLIDTDRKVHHDAISLGVSDTEITGSAVHFRRMRGGLRDGVDSLEVDNGKLRTVLLPTRGMGVWKAWLDNWEIGWKSPVRGPVHPKFVPIADPTGLGWLDGFDELLCRCGLSSNGAPDFNEQGRLTWPLHGRIANLPAHKLEVECDREDGQIAVCGVVDECRFHFLKLRLTSTWLTRAGEAGFRIVDEVTNLSGAQGEMELLYHINLGEPLLDAGAKIIAPVRTVAPRDAHAAETLEQWETFPPPKPGFAEQVYLFQLQPGDDGRTRALLRNSGGTRGVSVSFPIAQLPYFIVWKNAVASQDGYVCGLEPAINFPNPRSFEERHGRVRKLLPGETLRFELQIEIHDDAADVERIERAIYKMQQPLTTTLYRKPRAEWSG